jgi:hypothetical protein
MSLSKFYKQWKVALINSDRIKIDKLRSIVESTIYDFPGASSFIDHLKTMTDARECLILIAPTHLISDLPVDIEEKLLKLYIYDEKDEKELPSFDDVCLHLSNLIFAQCTEQSIYFRRSNENGPARVFAQESIIRSKNLIQQLQGLCDDIDEKIFFGQQANN